MEELVHCRYIPKDVEQYSAPSSSITVLRLTDSESFVACPIPDTKTKDPKKDTATTHLASVLLPTAGVSLSRILNHPNIISLVDIVQGSSNRGQRIPPGFGDLTVWEDMNAGCLSYILPSPNSVPFFNDAKGWHALAAQDYHRFSLPESLCWHVLLSISNALLWLHHGVKETDGIRHNIMKHDDDWHPILIRDISPGQIWFKKPKRGAMFGECKIGGFQWAKVTGLVGGEMAIATKMAEASPEKQFYWAPEIHNDTSPWSRPSEIWSLGAVIFTMMTGMPPPRGYNFAWQISRMGDKGFSEGLRGIVAKMLEPEIKNRPDALLLLGEAQRLWRDWRANTPEGMAYVDVSDELAGIEYESEKGAQERVGLPVLF